MKADDAEQLKELKREIRPVGLFPQLVERFRPSDMPRC